VETIAGGRLNICGGLLHLEPTCNLDFGCSVDSGRRVFLDVVSKAKNESDRKEKITKLLFRNTLAEEGELNIARK
jgi:hypothetical protein